MTQPIAHANRMRPLRYATHLITDRADDADFKVGLEHVEGWTGRLLSSETKFEGDGIRFRRGDVLFGKLRPYLAKAWIADRDGAAVGDFLVLRPEEGLHPQFIRDCLLSAAAIQEISATVYGSKMPRASWNTVGALSIPDLQWPDQVALVEYVDRETAEIDAFIADQEQLIALLTERRAATISHAVTKGLDPSAPMKDSGAEWLGRVPDTWQVLPLGRLLRIRSGSALPSEGGDDGFPVWGGNGQMGVTASSANTPPGSLVIGRVGALCGNVRLCTVAAWVTDNALVARLSTRGVDLAFLFYLLVTRNLNSIADRTAQPLITGSAVAAQRVCLPTIDVQEDIVASLSKETAEIDAAISDARDAIALSKERRAALITAAVTGQIDATAWRQAREPAAAFA